MNTNDGIISFVRGLEDYIYPDNKNILSDGKISFAIDTGNIYIDARMEDGTVKRKIAGGDSGIFYTSAQEIKQDNTQAVRDNYGISVAYSFDVNQIIAPKNKVPAVDNLVINSNGSAFRILDIDKTKSPHLLILQKLALSGSGGGGTSTGNFIVDTGGSGGISGNDDSYYVDFCLVDEFGNKLVTGDGREITTINKSPTDKNIVFKYCYESRKNATQFQDWNANLQVEININNEYNIIRTIPAATNDYVTTNYSEGKPYARTGNNTYYQNISDNSIILDNYLHAGQNIITVHALNGSVNWVNKTYEYYVYAFSVDITSFQYDNYNLNNNLLTPQDLDRPIKIQVGYSGSMTIENLQYDIKYTSLNNIYTGVGFYLDFSKFNDLDASNITNYDTTAIKNISGLLTIPGKPTISNNISYQYLQLDLSKLEIPDTSVFLQITFSYPDITNVVFPKKELYLLYCNYNDSTQELYLLPPLNPISILDKLLIPWDFYKKIVSSTPEEQDAEKKREYNVEKKIEYCLISNTDYDSSKTLNELIEDLCLEGVPGDSDKPNQFSLFSQSHESLPQGLINNTQHVWAILDYPELDESIAACVFKLAITISFNDSNSITRYAYCLILNDAEHIVYPITNNKIINFSARGHSNQDKDLKHIEYLYNKTAKTFMPSQDIIFNNISFQNGDGWLRDNNGTSILRILPKSEMIFPVNIFGTNDSINYPKLNIDNAPVGGRKVASGTLEIDFATRFITDYSEEFLQYGDTTHFKFTPLLAEETYDNHTKYVIADIIPHSSSWEYIDEKYYSTFNPGVWQYDTSSNTYQIYDIIWNNTTNDNQKDYVWYKIQDQDNIVYYKKASQKDILNNVQLYKKVSVQDGNKYISFIPLNLDDLSNDYIVLENGTAQEKTWNSQDDFIADVYTAKEYWEVRDNYSDPSIYVYALYEYSPASPAPTSSTYNNGNYFYLDGDEYINASSGASWDDEEIYYTRVLNNTLYYNGEDKIDSTNTKQYYIRKEKYVFKEKLPIGAILTTGTDNLIGGSTSEYYALSLGEVKNKDLPYYYIKVEENMTKGLVFSANRASFKTLGDDIHVYFQDEKRTRISYVFETLDSERIIKVYINGILSQVLPYNEYSVTWDDLSTFKIATNNCGLDIYEIVSYDKSLSALEIVQNYIASLPYGEHFEKSELNLGLDANVINKLKENEEVPEDILLSLQRLKIPYMILEAPVLPLAKKKSGTEIKKGVCNCSIKYVDPVDVQDSFETYYNVRLGVQGSTSAVYPTKNFELNLRKVLEQSYINKSGKTKYKELKTLIQTISRQGKADLVEKINYSLKNNRKYCLRKNEAGEPISEYGSKFVLKADFASSEGANNVELVRYYNDTLTKFYKSYPQKRQEELGKDITIRYGIDGKPLLLFWKSRPVYKDEKGEQYEDTEYYRQPKATSPFVFLGKYNFLYHKDLEDGDVFGFDYPEDINQCECWELRDNNLTTTFLEDLTASTLTEDTVTSKTISFDYAEEKENQLKAILDTLFNEVWKANAYEARYFPYTYNHISTYSAEELAEYKVKDFYEYNSTAKVPYYFKTSDTVQDESKDYFIKEDFDEDANENIQRKFRKLYEWVASTNPHLATNKPFKYQEESVDDAEDFNNKKSNLYVLIKQQGSYKYVPVVLTYNDSENYYTKGTDDKGNIIYDLVAPEDLSETAFNDGLYYIAIQDENSKNSYISTIFTYDPNQTYYKYQSSGYSKSFTFKTKGIDFVSTDFTSKNISEFKICSEYCKTGYSDYLNPLQPHYTLQNNGTYQKETLADVKADFFIDANKYYEKLDTGIYNSSTNPTGYTLRRGKNDTEQVFSFKYDTSTYRLAKFKKEFEDWFELEPTLFYYLFTELFVMIDSRAKNLMITTYDGKKWLPLPYDMDTAIGIDNDGYLDLSKYNYDTTANKWDQIELSATSAFTGAGSVLWENIYYTFQKELKTVYGQADFNYATINKYFTDHQKYWPEIFWNEDAQVKYLEHGVKYIKRLQGSKATQREIWLSNAINYRNGQYNVTNRSKALIFRSDLAGPSLIEMQSCKTGRVALGTGQAGNNATTSSEIEDKGIGAFTLLTANDIHTTLVPNPRESGQRNTQMLLFNPEYVTTLKIGEFVPYSFETLQYCTKIKNLDLSVNHSNPGLTCWREGSYVDQDGNSISVSTGVLSLNNNLTLEKLNLTGTQQFSSTLNLSDNYLLTDLILEDTTISSLSLPIGGRLERIKIPNDLSTLTLSHLTRLTTVEWERKTNTQQLNTLILDKTNLFMPAEGHFNNRVKNPLEDMIANHVLDGSNIYINGTFDINGIENFNTLLKNLFDTGTGYNHQYRVNYKTTTNNSAPYLGGRIVIYNRTGKSTSEQSNNQLIADMGNLTPLYSAETIKNNINISLAILDEYNNTVSAVQLHYTGLKIARDPQLTFINSPILNSAIANQSAFDIVEGHLSAENTIYSYQSAGQRNTEKFAYSQNGETIAAQLIKTDGVVTDTKVIPIDANGGTITATPIYDQKYKQVIYHVKTGGTDQTLSLLQFIGKNEESPVQSLAATFKTPFTSYTSKDATVFNTKEINTGKTLYQYQLENLGVTSSTNLESNASAKNNVMLTSIASGIQAGATSVLQNFYLKENSRILNDPIANFDNQKYNIDANWQNSLDWKEQKVYNNTTNSWDIVSENYLPVLTGSRNTFNIKIWGFKTNNNYSSTDLVVFYDGQTAIDEVTIKQHEDQGDYDKTTSEYILYSGNEKWMYPAAGQDLSVWYKFSGRASSLPTNINNDTAKVYARNWCKKKPFSKNFGSSISSYIRNHIYEHRTALLNSVQQHSYSIENVKPQTVSSYFKCDFGNIKVNRIKKIVIRPAGAAYSLNLDNLPDPYKIKNLNVKDSDTVLHTYFSEADETTAFVKSLTYTVWPSHEAFADSGSPYQVTVNSTPSKVYYWYGERWCDNAFTDSNNPGTSENPNATWRYDYVKDAIGVFKHPNAPSKAGTNSRPQTIDLSTGTFKVYLEIDRPGSSNGIYNTQTWTVNHGDNFNTEKVIEESALNTINNLSESVAWVDVSTATSIKTDSNGNEYVTYNSTNYPVPYSSTNLKVTKNSSGNTATIKKRTAVNGKYDNVTIGDYIADKRLWIECSAYFGIFRSVEVDIYYC